MISRATEIIWNVLISWTFLMSLAFVIYYNTVANWRINEFGKSLMVYQIAMTIVLGFTSFESLVDGVQSPLPVQLAEMALFAVVPLALTWRLVALVRIRKEVQLDGVEESGQSARPSGRITPMFKNVKKALAGAMTGGLAALGQALADGAISPAEVSIVVGSFVGGFVLVYLAPKNAPSSES